MGEAPAFQLYAADFYMDTASWTVAEVGAYFRLLMHEWVNGPLPSDMASLARIAGISDARTLYKMWSTTVGKKFTTTDGNLLINRRLEEERGKQHKRRELQAQKGRSGAKKRWGNDIAGAITQAQPNDSSSSSSSLIPPIVPQISEVTEKQNGIPYTAIRQLWVEILPELPKPHPKNDGWHVNCKARWVEDEKRQSLDWWKRFFTKIRQFPFYLGENDRNWRAHINWVMKREKFYSLLEKRAD